jgi:probable phosphoglycerate mutase
MMLEQTGDAVFFTHFLVINAIVGSVLDHPQTLYFWPDNGSVTHLRVRNQQLELVALGRDMKTVVN